jgi:hypothetical protein
MYIEKFAAKALGFDWNNIDWQQSCFDLVFLRVEFLVLQIAAKSNSAIVKVDTR